MNWMERLDMWACMEQAETIMDAITDVFSDYSDNIKYTFTFEKGDAYLYIYNETEQLDVGFEIGPDDYYTYATWCDTLYRVEQYFKGEIEDF